MRHPSKKQPPSPAFSLIELLVGIAIIAVLATILVTIVRSSVSKAHQVQCASNLRQLGQCISLYTNENGGYLPTWNTWSDGSGANYIWDNYHSGYREDGTPIGGVLSEIAGYHPGGSMTLEQYVTPGAKHIFNCPANESTTSAMGYSANRLVLKSVDASSPNNGALHMMNILHPSRVIMITDNYIETFNIRWFDTNTWEQGIGFDRHGGQANVLFADLSVSSMGYEDVQLRNLDPDGN